MRKSSRLAGMTEMQAVDLRKCVGVANARRQKALEESLVLFVEQNVAFALLFL